MRLGIFGGAFDPVTRAHIRIAKSARRKLRLNRVLLIPTRISPHTQKRDRSAPRHRRKMLELSVRGHAGLKICDVELRRRGRSYTVDTVRALRRRHPRAEWFVVIGADNARSLGTWKKIETLATWVTFAVVARPGYRWKPPRVPGLRTRRLGVPPSRTSSTRIRSLARGGRALEKWVPPAVAAYIIRHELYQ